MHTELLINPPKSPRTEEESKQNKVLLFLQVRAARDPRGSLYRSHYWIYHLKIKHLAGTCYCADRFGIAPKRTL